MESFKGQESERIYYDTEIVKIIWETMGGGDIKFEIIKIDNYFQIRVTRYEFKKINKTLLLTSESKNVYDLVHNIFDKKMDVYDKTSIPGGPTGTWTSITLIYSEDKKVTITNINGRLLHILYDFVHNNISSH